MGCEEVCFDAVAGHEGGFVEDGFLVEVFVEGGGDFVLVLDGGVDGHLSAGFSYHDAIYRWIR